MRYWSQLFFIACTGLLCITGYSWSEGTNFYWSFQQPTHLVEKDNLELTTYNCDMSQTACKVNFDFTASLPKDEPSSHYLCTVDFGFGVTGQEKKCNPSTVEFPVGSWTVHVLVNKVSDGSTVSEGSIVIVHSDDSIDPLQVTYKREWQSPTYLLNKDDAVSEYICDSKEPACKMNMIITPLLNGIFSSALSCEISADFELIPTSDPCNPNTSIVPTGEHTVVIKILDKAKNIVLQTSTFVLKNIPEETAIKPEQVTYTKEWQSPTYLLGKEDTTLSEYTCDPEQTECKINLLFHPLLDASVSSRITCLVEADFELTPTSDPCNPNTSIVPKGEHIITLKVLDTASNVLIKTFSLSIKNIPKEDVPIDPTRITTDITFQQPTYVTTKEEDGHTIYVCDKAKTECRINLLITPKLDGTSSSKISCRISTDFGVDINSCNPDTIIVPTGNHLLILHILDVYNGNTIITKQEIPIQGLSGGGVISGGGSSGFLDLSSSKIVIQSGLDEKMNCKSDTCQVNFSTESPESTLCSWDFGTGIYDTKGTDKKCNPGYVYFQKDSIVTVTLSDPNNAANTVTRLLFISTKKNSNNTDSHSSFQAKIILQSPLSKNKIITSEGFKCIANKDGYCSLNFVADTSLKGSTYEWDFGDSQTFIGDNPNIHKFLTGKWRVHLRVSHAGESLVDSLIVEVVGDAIINQEPPCRDCSSYKNKIQISAVFPNPPHSDTVEWIELKNISTTPIDINGCIVQDDSKKYTLRGLIGSNSTVRLNQMMTGLNLGNSHEELELICGDTSLDNFVWDFPVPDGYILRREVLYPEPIYVPVVGVVDGDTVDVIVEGKKIRVRLLGVDTPETVHPRRPVEKFGKEASDFTRLTLLNKSVWMTFDEVPVDHYGRRLAYIWLCDGTFSESSCDLFNRRLIREGYGRMERRFEFVKYIDFDSQEKEAKNQKKGLWSDAEVTKTMNELSSQESEEFDQEQQQEYLKTQEEILAACELDDADCQESEIDWQKVTEKNSTLKIRTYKDGGIVFSGQSWAHFEVVIRVKDENGLIREWNLQTDENGYYEMKWIPENTGNFTVESLFKKGDESVVKEEKLKIDKISEHFLSSLEGFIRVQGKETKNRFQKGDTFYCQSRGNCSVNVTAISNRENDVSYLWIFPDGSISDKENPTAFSLGYGHFSIILLVTDNITGEVESDLINIEHVSIPKSSKESESQKYTLDIKDIPQDIGGGAVPEVEPPLKELGKNVITLLLVFLFHTYWKKRGLFDK